MEISEIKSKLTINQVLSHYNLTPDRNNRLCCPWHSDKTPSLQIFAKTNTWTCFSSNCDAGSGDVIEMIQRMENCTKHEAIMKAKTMVTGGSQIPQKQIEREVIDLPKQDLADLEDKDQVRIAILTKYYQTTITALPRSKKGVEYAKSRNLNPGILGIGYSGADIGKRWNKHLQESGSKIGVLKEGKNKDGETVYLPKLKYVLIFAMKNRDGKVIDIYGRSIMDKPNSKHFYLSGKQRGLYPHYPGMETKKLILTESIIDAACLYQQDQIRRKYSILAFYGTNGFTPEHGQAIRSLELLEEVTFFFDGDEAGKKAVEKWTPEILKLNQKAKITNVETPVGEDINSLIIGHDPEILSHLINARKQVIKQPISKNEQQDFSFLPARAASQAGSTESRTLDTELNSESPAGQLKTDKLEAKNIKSVSRLLDFNASNPELITFTTPQLQITVMGGIKITGLDRMKVTLKIQRSDQQGNRTVRHSLDLYHAKQVEQISEMMAADLEMRASQAKTIISELTSKLENYRQSKLEAMKPKAAKSHEMSEAEKAEAQKFLKDELLIVNTAQAIKNSGIVGEEKNAMIGYVIYLSRKQEKPLHVMYLGSSGSGKTHVQEGLSNLIPEEDKEEATGMSPQSLYYEGLNLKGKVFFIEDLDGAQDVLYVIRELQTKTKITKKVAVRDNRGNTQTVKVTAEGPVVISSCTTKERLYEDNANRCILLYIDQSKEQDARVMDYIKAKSCGRIKTTDQEKVRRKMQNVQRILQPIKVYNPYADLIDLPAEVFKPRRSLPLLLGFIETVTYYYQLQRSVKYDTETNQKYICSTYEDIQISFNLLKDVLFNKSDELSKAVRQFLETLKKKVSKGETFYTKKIRKELRMNASNLKRYMIELQRYGYVQTKGGSRYRGYEYEVTDYGEYETLKSSIDNRLAEILEKIKQAESGEG